MCPAYVNDNVAGAVKTWILPPARADQASSIIEARMLTMSRMSFEGDWPTPQAMNFDEATCDTRQPVPIVRRSGGNASTFVAVHHPSVDRRRR
jgi:hypothetical protein